MTAQDYYDLWPLWVYLSGVVSTFMAAIAKGAYNDEYISDPEYIMGSVGVSIFWPVTMLYFGGAGVGLTLRNRKAKILLNKQEQKQLAAKEAKLLKEAGL